MSISESERIVYFGDSLTENGKIYEITSQILAVPFPLDDAGYDGVFSNGRVYSQILPVLLGIPVVANYAVGGAEAIGSKPVSELGGGALEPLLLPDAPETLIEYDINLGAQVARFLVDEAADPFEGRTTASLFIGLNDFAGLMPPGGGDPVQQGVELLGGVLAATFGAAATLALAGGVDEVVFYSFPDAAFFPFAQSLDPALLPLAEQLVAGHEAGLRLGAAVFELAGIETEIVDLGEIGDEISADPRTFGFLDFGPVLLGIASNPQVAPDGSLFFPENPAVAGLDPDQVVFYDFLHPTTALHGVWAAYSAAVLEDRTQFLGDGNNVSLGSSGNDFVLARAGDDTLILGGGDDTAFAGLGDDRAWGQHGSDILAGGSGNDTLNGGDDPDVLAGNEGDDMLFGGDGADALIDGLGSDRVFGGDGDDAFFYAEASLIGGTTGADADWFFGEGGIDTLFLAVSDANRATAQAEIDAGGGPLGEYQFAALELSLSGIETVTLLDRPEFGDAPVPAELQAALDEAGLWGLV